MQRGYTHFIASFLIVAAFFSHPAVAGPIAFCQRNLGRIIVKITPFQRVGQQPVLYKNEYTTKVEKYERKKAKGQLPDYPKRFEHRLAWLRVFTSDGRHVPLKFDFLFDSPDGKQSRQQIVKAIELTSRLAHEKPAKADKSDGIGLKILKTLSRFRYSVGQTLSWGPENRGGITVTNAEHALKQLRNLDHNDPMALLTGFPRHIQGIWKERGGYLKDLREAFYKKQWDYQQIEHSTLDILEKLWGVNQPGWAARRGLSVRKWYREKAQNEVRTLAAGLLEYGQIKALNYMISRGADNITGIDFAPAWLPDLRALNRFRMHPEIIEAMKTGGPDAAIKKADEIYKGPLARQNLAFAHYYIRKAYLTSIWIFFLGDFGLDWWKKKEEEKKAHEEGKENGKVFTEWTEKLPDAIRAHDPDWSGMLRSLVGYEVEIGRRVTPEEYKEFTKDLPKKLENRKITKEEHRKYLREHIMEEVGRLPEEWAIFLHELAAVADPGERRKLEETLREGLSPEFKERKITDEEHNLFEAEKKYSDTWGGFSAAERN